MIEQNVKSIIESLPPGVLLVAAAKTRTREEVESAIHGGIELIGYNYVQEAEQMYEFIGNRVNWHMIGHLQSNKVKRAVRLFDMIETIDSLKLAKTVDRHCGAIDKIMPVLIEVNSGRESSKTGVMPDDVDDLIEAMKDLTHVCIQGLMTMGPSVGDPEDARPYFKTTRQAFERLQKSGTEMRYLSMGMSNSYRIAIDEGANIIRIGTKLFG